MTRALVLILATAVMAVALAACGGEAPEPQVIEVPKEVIVEKEVIKEVPVEVVVEKEVVREVQVPGVTQVVEKIVEVEAPTKFGEAPMLAQLVLAGKLPPVEDRVPDPPLGDTRLQGDRQVRRHGEARLHRPHGRLLQRWPDHRRWPCPLDQRRDRDHPQCSHQSRAQWGWYGLTAKLREG